MSKYDNDKMDKLMMNEHISYEDMINISIEKNNKKNSIVFIFFSKLFSLIHSNKLSSKTGIIFLNSSFSACEKFPKTQSLIRKLLSYL